MVEKASRLVAVPFGGLQNQTQVPCLESLHTVNFVGWTLVSLRCQYFLTSTAKACMLSWSEVVTGKTSLMTLN